MFRSLDVPQKRGSVKGLVGYFTPIYPMYTFPKFNIAPEKLPPQ